MPAPQSPSPLITFEDQGKAAVLSYNVPEPTSYNGQLVLSLMERGPEAPPDSDIARYLAPPRAGAALGALTREAVLNAMRNGFDDPSIFPNLGVPPGTLKYVDRNSTPRYWRNMGMQASSVYYAVYTGVLCPNAITEWAGSEFYVTDTGENNYGQPIAPKPGNNLIDDALMALSPDEVYAQLQAGFRLIISIDGSNRYTYRWVLPSDKVRLAIIEKHRLTTYLGSYGAGRTIQTFSLLPGEKTRLVFKTYKKTITDAKAASSILDSYTEDSANEFEKAVSSEHASKEDEKHSHEWHVEAEAEQNWGFVSVKASAGYKGSANSSREQAARNMANATQKHAAKASSKRDISINQATETKTETGEESGIEREIQNINVGRTLNFVFRQMNQEFITILHLTDVQLGYYDSSFGVKRFNIGEMDKLLDLAVAPPPYGLEPSEQQAWTAAARQAIRSRILDELSNIVDHQDQAVSFVEQRTISSAPDGAGGTVVLDSPITYWRTRNDMTSTYADPTSGAAFSVPGVILAVTKNVMRTDGIIVEAVLGQGNGLDDYSQSLQGESVRSKKLENDLLDARNKRLQLAASILASKDATQAALFGKLFPPPPLLPPAMAAAATAKAGEPSSK
jgi:hypothetical protein